MPVKNKDISRKRRHNSLRKQISGSPTRPRLVVHRSAKHVYAQVIDDTTNNTLATASDLISKKTPAPEWIKAKKQDRAKQVGILVAKACIAKGISQVVFDRAGYRYHGRVSMIAIGAREGGLKF
jgi:large subunit ribosomal protein L18